MVGPAVACHLADYEIPDNEFHLTIIRRRRHQGGV